MEEPLLEPELRPERPVLVEDVSRVVPLRPLRPIDVVSVVVVLLEPLVPGVVVEGDDVLGVPLLAGGFTS